MMERALAAHDFQEGGQKHTPPLGELAARYTGFHDTSRSLFGDETFKVWPLRRV
jgi:hypothetical protein